MIKKSFLFGRLLGMLFLMFISINVFGQTFGDVNGNGVVEIVDALITAQFSVGLPVPDFDEISANVDAVNGVTIVDALMIAQFFVGLIDKFPADDIQPSPTPVSGSENIINGDFANGVANWNAGYYAPGAGSSSVSEGELHIGISDGGSATWNVQINQGGINIVSGTNYTFSFDARSLSSRTIEANVGMSAAPYVSYFASGSLSLSTSMTTYSFTFTASANDATARVEFNCGLNANDVYLDNVSLSGGSGSTTPEPPESILINFANPNLEAAIRKAVNVPEGPIYNTDVYNLSSMDLCHLDITDITGLEHFKALTQLILSSNYGLLDITPLENLTNLKAINLGANYLSDLTPLKNLTNLTQLNLVVNNISDLTPLENLTNLTSLLADYNEIIDLTPLANLTKMTNLILNDNEIIDLTSLRNLTNVTNLELSNNHITDISSLANLTKVTKLNLCGNPISDITALENMTELNTLVLNVKLLEDITPLANLTKLISLNLSNNQISDITLLTNLINLNVVYLIGNPLNDSAQTVIDSLRANGTRVVY